MFKKVFIAALALSVLCCLAACGKKEAEDVVPEESLAEEVVPGEMVLIPEGEFIMGSNDKSDGTIAFPEHKVKLPAFWIDKYEVTNFEFMEFSIANKYAGEGVAKGKNWRDYFTLGKENVPVTTVTWKDAYEYCKAKGKRLPTEAEWEYAARGPNGNLYPWGNEWEDGRTNTYEMGNDFVDVGQCNDVSYFGVHDMFGNVQEWTGTWYKTYPGGEKDPSSGEKFRVVRGFSTTYKGKLSFLYQRNAQAPTEQANYGFRCAKDAAPGDK